MKMASEAYQGRPSFLRKPGSLAAGGWVVAFLAVASLISAAKLDLFHPDLWPTAGGGRLAGDFFNKALHPTLHFMGPESPTEVWALPLQALKAAANTVVFAATAMSLALVGGLGLVFLGSSVWWDFPGESGLRFGPATNNSHLHERDTRRAWRFEFRTQRDGALGE